MKNSEIISRLAKVDIYPQKIDGYWEWRLNNGNLIKSKTLKGLFGIPSENARELAYLSYNNFN